MKFRLKGMRPLPVFSPIQTVFDEEFTELINSTDLNPRIVFHHQFEILLSSISDCISVERYAKYNTNSLRFCTSIRSQRHSRPSQWIIRR